ncbi:MAG: hypothetical protein ACLFPJ_05175 [Candidatus Woesearchaeota archaeon]
MLPKNNITLFVNEFYLLMLMLIFAGIGFYSIKNEMKIGYLLFSVLFSIIVLNGVYLYLFQEQNFLIFIFLVLFGLIGLFKSINSISCSECRDCKPIENKEYTKPKTIIVDSVDIKKPVATKKTKKKKTSKAKKAVATKKAKKTSKAKKVVAKKKTSKAKKVVAKKKAKK